MVGGKDEPFPDAPPPRFEIKQLLENCFKNYA
jgi:hypothetical protein